MVIPPKYENAKDMVLISEEQEKYRKVPAKIAYMTRREKVLDEEQYILTLHETERLVKRRIRLNEGEVQQVVVPAQRKRITKKITIIN